MPSFAIEHLDAERLADAWPIVRMVNAHANSGWWISEAEALVKRGGGILVARGPDERIYAVATYEVAGKPFLGRILAVDTLVSFELSRRAPARRALDDALALLMKAFDCRCLVLRHPSNVHLEHRARMIHGLPGTGPEPDMP